MRSVLFTVVLVGTIAANAQDVLRKYGTTVVVVDGKTVTDSMMTYKCEYDREGNMLYEYDFAVDPDANTISDDYRQFNEDGNYKFTHAFQTDTWITYDDHGYPIKHVVVTSGDTSLIFSKNFYSDDGKLNYIVKSIDGYDASLVDSIRYDGDTTFRDSYAGSMLYANEAIVKVNDNVTYSYQIQQGQLGSESYERIYTYDSDWNITASEHYVNGKLFRKVNSEFEDGLEVVRHQVFVQGGYTMLITYDYEFY